MERGLVKFRSFAMFREILKKYFVCGFQGITVFGGEAATPVGLGTSQVIGGEAATPVG